MRLNEIDGGELLRFLASRSTDRRAVLGALAGGALGFLALKAAAARGSFGRLFVSCCKDEAGHHHVAGLRADGRIDFRVPLPGRGHSSALRPGATECCVFARRPGELAVVVDLDEGVALHRIDARAGRHFYGHGTFSADGRYLLTSENDVERGVGLIGIRDATDGWKQVGEIESYGVGPHDIRLTTRGAAAGHLLVANGGIRTHPDFGRIKLNLDTMAPSLTLIEPDSGRLRHEWRLPPELHRLSIRHLAQGRQGRTVVAMQDEAEAVEPRPLVALLEAEALRLLDVPRRVLARCRRYTGSAAFDASGRFAAVSAPRGGLVLFFDTDAAPERAYLHHVELADGCGVAPADEAGCFMLTSGTGAVVHHRIGQDGPVTRPLNGAGVAWDNHLMAYSLT